MKKVFLLFSLIIITLSACTQKENGFTIKAEAIGLADSTRVLLKQYDSLQKLVNLDTAFVKDGKFVLHTFPKNTKLGIVMVDGINGAIPLFVEPTGTVEVTFHKDSINKAKFGGTKTNDEFFELFDHSNQLNDKVRKISMELRTLSQNNDTLGIQKAVEKRNNLRKEDVDYGMNFAKNHKNSVVSFLIIQNLISMNPDKLDEIVKMYDEISPEAKKAYADLKPLDERITMLRKTMIGSVLEDVSGKTPGGDTLALNQVKGKVTLVDFWASWCVPCRQENPNIIKIYDAYKNEGLSILGISLDQNEVDWKKAIEDDKLTWNQIVSEESARQFNLSKIPSSFLLDKAGKIVAKDLRGKELEAEIAKTLGVSNKNVISTEDINDQAGL